FYFVRNKVSSAFYFDFEDYAYTAADVRNMIEPVINTKKEDDECCYLYVLENIDHLRHSNQDNAEEISTLLTDYLAQGNYVIITSRGGEGSLDIPCNTVTLTPFSDVEQKALIATCLQQIDPQTSEKHS